MAATREAVTIDFGAGPRQLKYTISKTRMLKEQFGSLKNMLKVETLDDYENLPHLIYAGLTDTTSLTPERIGEMIEFRDAQDHYMTFVHAFSGNDPRLNKLRVVAESEKNDQPMEIGSEISTSTGAGASDITP